MSIKRPVLKDAKGDTAKRWFIAYTVFDPESGHYARRRQYLPRSISNKSERYRWAKHWMAECAGLHEWQPEERYNQFEVKANWPVAHALRKAFAIKCRFLRPDTVRTYRSIMKEFCKWADLEQLGTFQIRDFGVREAGRFMDYVSTKQVSARTYNNYRENLRSLWNVLIRRKVTFANPWKDQERAPVSTKIKRGMTPEQRSHTLQELACWDYPLYTFCVAMYYTFLRRKELAELRAGWIDLDSGRIFMPAETSKTRRDGFVRITPALDAVLRAMRVDEMPKNWFVWGYRLQPGPEPWHPTRFSERFRAFRLKLDLPEGICLYSFKYTGVQDHLLIGIPLQEIQKQARWADISIAQNYAESVGVVAGDVFGERSPTL